MKTICIVLVISLSLLVGIIYGAACTAKVLKETEKKNIQRGYIELDGHIFLLKEMPIDYTPPYYEENDE